MPCNSMAEARKSIFEMLIAGMPAGLYIQFPGIDKAEAPSTDGPWASVTLHIYNGKQASLAGDTGTRHYNKVGNLIVQSFGPLSSRGFTIAESLAEAVELCYKGKTGAGGIWFHRFQSQSVGPTRAWWQFNTTIGFEYSEYI